jgi:hypothetical protein
MSHTQSPGLSPAHRRYLILEQGVGAAVVNLVINGAIAWAMFRSLATVPLWGEQSIAGDTIGTTFLLPLITCLIVTPLARRQVHGGRLAPLGWRIGRYAMLDRLPATALRRGLVIGALSALFVAPLAILALSVSGVDSMSFGSFLIFKAIFAAALAAAVTPVISLCALADVSVPS